MGTGDRGARLLLVLLLALAAGATSLGALGVFAKTAYAQKAQLCSGEEQCQQPTGGSSCSVSSWGCGCSCSGTDSETYLTQCVCGAPVCRAYDFRTKQCFAREITCSCACPGDFSASTCPI